MRYFHFCAHEQFPPDDLLRQAVEAERAGFDGIGCSDHLQPWWEDGEAWATLEVMYPGRPYLGFGSGEALNEAPLGQGWPRPGSRSSGWRRRWR